MSNRKELRDARRRAKGALSMLASIEGLPRHVGQAVRWRNGVVWTRVGDDVWFPNGDRTWHYPSAHVAQFAWERVTPGDGSR